jgi:hypothetical protein
VQLVYGTDARNDINLADNPGNFGKTLLITGQVTKYFGVVGVKAPTAYELSGEGTTPDEPTVETADFGFVMNVTSGKSYLIYASDKVATPSTANYGYLPVTDATLAGNKINSAVANGFTLDAVDGGYTIKDSNGKYIYQTGSYNSFNYSTDRQSSGDIWTVEFVSDGTAKIVNAATGKTIQFTSYGNYGAYTDITGSLPMLFEQGAAGVEIPTVETQVVNSIAEFLALKATTPVKINCPVTAIYQNGSYLYVTDGTTPLLVYGALSTTYKNGDVIPAGITGTFQNYSSGQLQMSNPDADTFGAATAGTAVEPDVYQVEELSADMVSSYIKVLGVKLVAGSDANTFTLSDNTGDIALYNQFGYTVGAGENLTFIGFVAVHSGTTQLLPVADLGEGGGGGDEPQPGDNNTAYFYAPTYTGVTGTALTNADGSETSEDATDQSKSLVGGTYTEKGVTLTFTHGTGNYYAASFGNNVRWYQGEIATLTPEQGVTITKVYVKTAANSKGAFTAETGTVEGTGVGVDNPITWTGTAASALALTAEKQIRFSYIEVTTEGYTGIENVTVNDENAPAVYYNLQGVRVNNPANGVYIVVKGDKVSKVLVK